MTHIEIPDLPAVLSRALQVRAGADAWGGQHLHCSDLGDTLPDGCLRRVWLRINDYPKNDSTVGQLWRFARGNQVHEALTPLLRGGLSEGWEVCTVERPVGNELNRLFGIERGSLDVGLVNVAAQCALVVDYKTIKTAGLARLSAPKEDNVLQVQGYMEAWQAGLDLNETGWQVIGGLLIYADREGQGGFKQFFVRRDRAAVERAAAKLVSLRGMTEPPPGPPSNGKREHWKCSYRTADGETTTCPYLGISCPGSLALAAQPVDLEAALRASLLSEKGADA